MILETGWNNDDFMLNLFRMRIRDDENSIEFVIKNGNNGVINPDLYNRLMLKKALRVWTELKRKGLPNYFFGTHKLN